MEALAERSRLAATGNASDLSLQAIDRATISAKTVGASLSFSASTTASVALAISATVAKNTIESTVTAASRSSQLAAGRHIVLDADADDTITALGVAATISGSISPAKPSGSSSCGCVLPLSLSR